MPSTQRSSGSRRSSLQPNKIIVEEPPHRRSVGVLPHVYTLYPVHVPALIKLGVASKAEGGNSVIMGLEAAALAIPHLIGVGGTDSAILNPAVHAGGSA